MIGRRKKRNGSCQCCNESPIARRVTLSRPANIVMAHFSTFICQEMAHLWKFVLFCNCKKNLIGTLWVLDKRKWYLHFGRVVQLNWLIPEWANTRAHWCPNGITIVRYLLSTMLCCPLPFLEHFLHSVCCSGIGLGGALCVLMSGTLRAIDWRSGPTFSGGLSERHIGVSCESSPDETLTWNKNHVEEFLWGHAQRVNNVLKHGNSSLLTDDDQMGCKSVERKHLANTSSCDEILFKFPTDWPSQIPHKARSTFITCQSRLFFNMPISRNIWSGL